MLKSGDLVIFRRTDAFRCRRGIVQRISWVNGQIVVTVEMEDGAIRNVRASTLELLEIKQSCIWD